MEIQPILFLIIYITIACIGLSILLWKLTNPNNKNRDHPMEWFCSIGLPILWPIVFLIFLIISPFIGIFKIMDRIRKHEK